MSTADSIITLKIALIHCVPAVWKWNQKLETLKHQKHCRHFDAIRIILLNHLQVIEKTYRISLIIIKQIDFFLVNLAILKTIPLEVQQLLTFQIQNVFIVLLYSVRISHCLFYTNQSFFYQVTHFKTLILLSQTSVFFHFILIICEQYQGY